MQFEWDTTKDYINQRKHGISFSTAKKVFGDVNRLDVPDEFHSYEEERRITIGKAGSVLFVVYTVRRNNVIRLISARKANAAERKFYYDCNRILEY